MSIRDNLGGAGDIKTEELFAALRYSGIVTEDMTADEMLEALFAKYPNIYYLLGNGSVLPGYLTYKAMGGAVTVSNNKITFSITGSQGRMSSLRWPSVDLQGFKTLSFSFTEVSNGNLFRVGVYAENATVTDDTNSASGVKIINVTKSGTYTIDVSSLNGKYCIALYAGITSATVTEIKLIS